MLNGGQLYESLKAVLGKLASGPDGHTTEAPPKNTWYSCACESCVSCY